MTFPSAAGGHDDLDAADHDPLGVASAVALGLLMGYVYDRTGNMVAPWLGHALAGLALVLTGTMTFLTYNP